MGLVICAIALNVIYNLKFQKSFVLAYLFTQRFAYCQRKGLSLVNPLSSTASIVFYW